MFALAWNGLSRGLGYLVTHHQPVSGLGLFQPFSSSATRSKFRRAQPTDAELQEMGQKLRWYYEKRQDPEWRQQTALKQQLLKKNLKKLRQDDPEFKAKELLRWREDRRRWYADERYRKRDLMYAWLRRIPESQREAYDWKTHKPVVFSKPQRETCSFCSDCRTTTLWWKRLDSQSAPQGSDTELYTCHGCYMNRDMSEIMPRGHEDYIVGVGKPWPKP